MIGSRTQLTTQSARFLISVKFNTKTRNNQNRYLKQFQLVIASNKSRANNRLNYNSQNLKMVYYRLTGPISLILADTVQSLPGSNFLPSDDARYIFPDSPFLPQRIMYNLARGSNTSPRRKATVERKRPTHVSRILICQAMVPNLPLVELCKHTNAEFRSQKTRARTYVQHPIIAISNNSIPNGHRIAVVNQCIVTRGRLQNSS